MWANETSGSRLTARINKIGERNRVTRNVKKTEEVEESKQGKENSWKELNHRKTQHMQQNGNILYL